MRVIKILANALLDKLGHNGERWVQGTWSRNNPDDPKRPLVCLHQAVKMCEPQRGDRHIVLAVANRQKWDTNFNDDKSTEWADILKRIQDGINVTDKDLLDTFGPNWEAVIATYRKVLQREQAEPGAASHMQYLGADVEADIARTVNGAPLERARQADAVAVLSSDENVLKGLRQTLQAIQFSDLLKPQTWKAAAERFMQTYGEIPQNVVPIPD